MANLIDSTSGKANGDVDLDSLDVPAGSVLIAIHEGDHDGAVADMTAAGFDLAMDTPTAGIHVKVWSRETTGSEPGSYTFGNSSNSGTTVALLAFDDCDLDDLFDVAPVVTATNTNSAQQAPSTTTTEDDTCLVISWLAQHYTEGEDNAFTFPGTMTGVVNVSTSYAFQGVAYEQRPTAGATGPRTATANNSLDSGNCVVTMALRSQASGGPVVDYTDVTNESFTGGGRTSTYHRYAAGIDPGQPVGMMFYFHGDGAYEFDNPTDVYSLAGPRGVIAEARKRNMILVPVRTPDSDDTWWNDGSANADFVRALILALDAEYAPDTLWLNGYSGGAQFITQFLLPKYPSLFERGGGSIVTGGGGTPEVTPATFSSTLKANFRMHWYTGQQDTVANSDEGYGGYDEGVNGEAYYAGQGFQTSFYWPVGVDHEDLEYQFGPITADYLNRDVYGDTTVSVAQTFESTTGMVSGTWTRVTRNGTGALASPATSDNGASDAVFAVPAGALAVRFRYQCSTQYDGDFLRLIIGSDDIPIASGTTITGQWAESAVYDLDGATTVTFRYKKNGANTAGSDKVWIDNLAFEMPDVVDPPEEGERVNLCTNPALSVGNDPQWFGPDGSARATGLTGMDRTTGFRAVAGEGGLTPPRFDVTPGQAYASSIQIKPSFSGTMSSSIDWYSATAYLSSTSGTLTVTAGVVTRAEQDGVAPAGAVEGVHAVGTPSFSLPGQVDATAAIVEAATVAGSYFDGDTPGATWDGAVGASTSRMAEDTTPPVGGAPTCVATFTTGSYDIGGPTGSTEYTQTVTASGVQAGDLLIIDARAYDNNGDVDVFPGLPAGGGLTYVERESIMLNDYCSSKVWTAVADADGTLDIDVTYEFSLVWKWGFAVQVWRNHGGVGSTGQAHGLDSTPELTMFAVAENSGIYYGNQDWDHVAGARAYRTGDAGAFEEDFWESTATFTVNLGHHSDVGAAGNKTVGQTAPAGQKWAVIAVEVLASGNPSLPESPAPEGWEFYLDISHFQGDDSSAGRIDLQQVYDLGYAGIVAKIGQGDGGIDSDWAEFRDVARPLWPDTFAGYWYLGETESPAAQASRCAAALGDLSIPIMLDWEEGGGDWTNLLAVLDAFRAQGLKVTMLYTGHAYGPANGMTDAAATGLALVKSRYWDDQIPGNVKDPRTIWDEQLAAAPISYGYEPLAGLTPSAHQFTSVGEIYPGMVVDVNDFHGTRVDLARRMNNGGSGGGSDDEAAVRYGWGTPLPSSDEFNYTGVPDPTKWGVYDGPGHGDPANGTRDAERCTVQDGYLRIEGTANGSTGGMAHTFDQQYGRWECRARMGAFNPGSSGESYHGVLIVWPESEQWPQDGEYDWLEIEDVEQTNVAGYLHYPTPSEVEQEGVTGPAVDLSEWHNYAFEWVEGALRGYVDGVEWFDLDGAQTASTGRRLDSMPSGHLTVQLDNFTGASGLQPGYMDIEWARVYDLSGNAGDPPSVYAGADATVELGEVFTRTATESTGSGITTRSWKITSGPAGVGSTIGTGATLSWTPEVAGSYVLTYSATNPDGTGTDTLVVTVDNTVRLWLTSVPADVAPDPETPEGLYWGNLGNLGDSLARSRLSTEQAGESVFTTITESSPNGGPTVAVLVAQWVSPPLVAGTIAGPFELGAAFDSNVSPEVGQLVPRLRIWVVTETGESRGDLAIADSALLAFPEDPTGFVIPADVTSTVVSDGDRVVLELGFRIDNTITDPVDGSYYFGGEPGGVAVTDGATNMLAVRSYIDLPVAGMIAPGTLAPVGVAGGSGSASAVVASTAARPQLDAAVGSGAVEDAAPAVSAEAAAPAGSGAAAGVGYATSVDRTPGTAGADGAAGDVRASSAAVVEAAVGQASAGPVGPHAAPVATAAAGAGAAGDAGSMTAARPVVGTASGEGVSPAWVPLVGARVEEALPAVGAAFDVFSASDVEVYPTVAVGHGAAGGISPVVGVHGGTAAAGTAFSPSTEVVAGLAAAAGSGSTSDAAAGVGPVAGSAGADGDALPLGVSTSLSTTPGTAVAGGQAGQVSASTSLSRSLGTAEAGGAAMVLDVAVDGRPSSAVADAVAVDATVSAAARAGSALVEGQAVAVEASTSLARTPEAAAGEGSAGAAAPMVGGSAGQGGGSSAVWPVSPVVAAVAGVASGEGRAGAIVTTGEVLAETVEGSGAAGGLSARVVAGVGQALDGAGAALSAGTDVGARPAAAAAAGSAGQLAAEVTAQLGVAEGSGAAAAATAGLSVARPLGVASGGGEGGAVAAVVSPGTTLAVGGGVVPDGDAAVLAAAGYGAGSGTAADAVALLGAVADPADGAGSVDDVTVEVAATVETGTGAGLASGLDAAIAAVAVQAVGAGQGGSPAAGVGTSAGAAAAGGDAFGVGELGQRGVTAAVGEGTAPDGVVALSAVVDDAVAGGEAGVPRPSVWARAVTAAGSGQAFGPNTSAGSPSAGGTAEAVSGAVRSPAGGAAGSGASASARVVVAGAASTAIGEGDARPLGNGTEAILGTAVGAGAAIHPGGSVAAEVGTAVGGGAAAGSVAALFAAVEAALAEGTAADTRGPDSWVHPWRVRARRVDDLHVERAERDSVSVSAT